MPRKKQPLSLESWCLKSIIAHLESYWLQKIYLKHIIEKTLTCRVKYIIGPFECLRDEHVDHILKELYQKTVLRKQCLILFMHNYIKTLDLSYIRRKNILTSEICYFMGNNCTNLVELDVSGHSDLAPKNLCEMLGSMCHLRKLNLSYTKANQLVMECVIKTCKKLESLNLEGCQYMYNECIVLLCYDSVLSKSLRHLNIEIDGLSSQVIVLCLLNLVNLKSLVAHRLLETITLMFQRLDQGESMSDDGKFVTEMLGYLNLESFLIQPDIVLLKPENMEALSLFCPSLKNLSINAYGTRDCLQYLINFNSLTELTIANTSASIVFEFGEHLLNILSTTDIGKQLKLLHLSSLVDVNLRSICKWCPSLVKLIVEFIGYYEPAVDKSLTESPSCNPIASLKHVVISNTNTKAEQINLNMGQFKSDLKLLMSNCKIKSLQLRGLGELDDSFFIELFTSRIRGIYMDSEMEILQLKEINLVTGAFIKHLILENSSLKELNLFGCKLIGKSDANHINSLIKKKRLDCKVNWS